MSKSDHELLALAAKAAGIALKWTNSGKHYTGGAPFNPLNDDGDALRLAVKLNMKIDINDHDERTRIRDEYGDVVLVCVHNECAMKATRIAIVRAAAAIGEKLP